MNKEEYEKLLATAPDHDTPEFIDFLKKYNKVIWENAHWLIIENCKYEGWRTAFWKGKPDMSNVYLCLAEVLDQYPECEWRKKNIKKQTVGRFHIHIIAE